MTDFFILFFGDFNLFGNFVPLNHFRTVMRVVNSEANGNSAKTMLYYSLIPKYLGDKRASYGRKFIFALNVNVPVNTTASDVTNTAGDVILTGKHTSNKMVATLPTAPKEEITEYSVSNIILRHTSFCSIP